MRGVAYISSVSVAVLLVFPFCMEARAESHRATFLGNPSTRFASPLHTPEDLRARFLDPQLRSDIASVLQQWDWRGNTTDLFAAAATAQIADIRIPVGYVLPFMSSRKDGRPICLRNVTWAGNEPAPAYAFGFSSNGRRYRCVTPKACCNFLVEDLGVEPRHGLTIGCTVTQKVLMGRKIEAFITVRNTGNLAEPEATVSLPLPNDCVLTEMSERGVVTGNLVTWQISNLPAEASKQIYAGFKPRRPGNVLFRPAVASKYVQPAQSACETSVGGISALLLQTADDPDPVAVGERTTYTVKVTNQGTADDTNVKMVVEFGAELTPVSASDGGAIEGNKVTFPAFPRLAPKQAFSYTITAKGVKAGDARVKFIRTSQDIPTPTTAEESTRVY